jgi:hypothetical protein
MQITPKHKTAAFSDVAPSWLVLLSDVPQELAASNTLKMAPP